MKKEISKNMKINWKKMTKELQQELDQAALNQLLQAPTDLDEKDLTKIEAIKQRLSQAVYQELESLMTKPQPDILNPIKKIKEIILNLEILPFQFATRTTDIKETGKPWRHDGGEVKFKLRMPHDKLEIYSTTGEFLCSYPVQSNGEILINNLEPGVYLLYLRGRKIVDMDLGEELK